MNYHLTLVQIQNVNVFGDLLVTPASYSLICLMWEYNRCYDFYIVLDHNYDSAVFRFVTSRNTLSYNFLTNIHILFCVFSLLAKYNYNTFG